MKNAVYYFNEWLKKAFVFTLEGFDKNVFVL